MAYVTPATLSTGCLVTAASWNQNVVNNVIAIATSPMSFDFANDRIGINNSAPGVSLDVISGSGNISARFRGSATANNTGVIEFWGGSSGGLFQLGTDGPGNGSHSLTIFDLTNNKFRLYLSASGAFVVNSSASNTKNTQGLTIQQGTATDEGLSLKNSSVAHGITGLTETDTFFEITPISASGGADIHGVGSTIVPAAQALSLRGWQLAGISSPGTGAVGAVHISGALKSGTSITGLSASTFILSVATQNGTRFLFREDGTSYEHVGTAWVNFDEQDDVALLNLAAAHLSRDPIRERFGAWLNENRKKLQDLDLVTFDDEGGHFVNRSRMQELLVGAVRQMSERNRQLEERIAQLERLLLPPKAGNPASTD